MLHVYTCCTSVFTEIYSDKEYLIYPEFNYIAILLSVPSKIEKV